MPAKSHPAILDGMGDQPTGGADQSQHNARAPGGGYAERQQPALSTSRVAGAAPRPYLGRKIARRGRLVRTKILCMT